MLFGCLLFYVRRPVWHFHGANLTYCTTTRHIDLFYCQPQTTVRMVCNVSCGQHYKNDDRFVVAISAVCARISTFHIIFLLLLLSFAFDLGSNSMRHTKYVLVWHQCGISVACTNFSLRLFLCANFGCDCEAGVKMSCWHTFLRLHSINLFSFSILTMNRFVHSTAPSRNRYFCVIFIGCISYLVLLYTQIMAIR